MDGVLDFYDKYYNYVVPVNVSCVDFEPATNFGFHLKPPRLQHNYYLLTLTYYQETLLLILGVFVD